MFLKDEFNCRESFGEVAIANVNSWEILGKPHRDNPAKCQKEIAKISFHKTFITYTDNITGVLVKEGLEYCKCSTKAGEMLEIALYCYLAVTQVSLNLN